MSRTRKAGPRRGGKPRSAPARSWPWGWLAVIAALAVAGVVADRLAPAQDLPWKPFSLERPIGWATHVQLAAIGYDLPRCEAALREGGVAFTPVEPRREGDCHVLNGVRITGGVAALQPASPMMSCQEALAFADWTRHAVQPAAQAVYGRPVVRIEHFGTYACRPIRGHTRGLSEHAFADAIDVSAFHLSDGRMISVLKSYRDPGDDGVFLHRVHDAGCQVFGHTLGPDFNADHKDHFHLDMGLWGPCR
jgi:hypothetical protein